MTKCKILNLKNKKFVAPKIQTLKKIQTTLKEKVFKKLFNKKIKIQDF